ncbi:MAG: hypothetical protein VW362_07560 [Candidatus Nanopelagicales bacterium]
MVATRRMTLALATILLLLLLANCATAQGGRIIERTTGPRAHPGTPTNRALLRIARCETGGINDGRPLWTHRARSEHPGLDYEGSLGFLETTWDKYRWQVRPLPPDAAWKATPAEQLAVARVLVRTFGGYSSWPACSRRLGLR